jgi:hypothetical protein
LLFVLWDKDFVLAEMILSIICFVILNRLLS